MLEAPCPQPIAALAAAGVQPENVPTSPENCSPSVAPTGTAVTGLAALATPGTAAAASLPAASNAPLANAAHTTENANRNTLASIPPTRRRSYSQQGRRGRPRFDVGLRLRDLRSRGLRSYKRWLGTPRAGARKLAPTDCAEFGMGRQRQVGRAVLFVRPGRIGEPARMLLGPPSRSSRSGCSRAAARLCFRPLCGADFSRWWRAADGPSKQSRGAA